MLDEKSKDYLNARRVAREYETIVKGLNKNMPSVPPTNTADELKQVHFWFFLSFTRNLKYFCES
jgi:cleavage stimulation factor subunit 3